jgi:hypothetical protein
MASKNNYAHHFKTNILQVMDNIKIRAKATMVINPHGVHYVLDGQTFPETVFNRIFSTDVRKLPNCKGEGLDSRSNWMQ